MVKFLALIILLQLRMFSVSYAGSISMTMILIGPNFTRSFHLVQADETTVEIGVFQVVETGVVYVAEPLQDCLNLIIPINKDWFGLCEKIQTGANSRRVKIGNSVFVTKATAETLKQYTCMAGVKVLFVDRYEESEWWNWNTMAKGFTFFTILYLLKY
ncbi:unnamed protein product [Microthlaspi erraticum]|uniref:Uncharacterized protein n=1 Tax=Microthlaspi erraticum TaxID=1685480 RepID=A0A6D2IC14_9BRAS|nr:unnamed protein product [Microthlaspi erraticum]